MKLQKIFKTVLLLAICNPANATMLKTSFYHQGFIGKKTASGEVFRQSKATAASNSYKFGTLLKLTYKGKSTTLCVNDTGSFGRKYHRDIDVSKSVATKLKFVKTGVVSLQSLVVYKPKKKTSCQKAWSIYASL